MAVAAKPKKLDGRRHSVVYSKQDARINDIIKRYKKSDIIKLYDIDCYMLLRVKAAYPQFDMNENNRPYITLVGEAEGVFLDEKVGLLFPNGCDQLDFRTDFKVDVKVNYKLADIEISTFSANGLYHSDYSCQGRIINSLLEIPCKIDYFAIMNTPITYVNIQNQFNINTSTRRTGYKTFASAFLPYNVQKHDLEDHPKLMTVAPKIDEKSAIRQRNFYDSKAFSFATQPSTRTMATGADFVEVAQSRIQQRLQNIMAKGDILETHGPNTTADIANAVSTIKAESDRVRKNSMIDYEHDASKVDNAALDAKINDMANRMAYSAGETIPVEVAPIKVDPLVGAKDDRTNDSRMTEPTTKVAASIGELNGETGSIESKSEAVKESVYNAEETANNIVKTLSRKEKLMLRRQQREQNAQAMQQAGQEEAKLDMNDKRKSGSEVGLPEDVKDEKTGETKSASKLQEVMKDDILSGAVDIDDIINTLGT